MTKEPMSEARLERRRRYGLEPEPVHLEIHPCRVCGKMTDDPSQLCSTECWCEVYNEDERDFRDEDERRPDNDETENGEEDEEQ